MFVLLSHTEIDMHACSHVSHTLCLWVFSYVFTHTARIIVDYYTYLSRKAETQAGRRIVLDLGLHTHTQNAKYSTGKVWFFFISYPHAHSHACALVVPGDQTGSSDLLLQETSGRRGKECEREREMEGGRKGKRERRCFA